LPKREVGGTKVAAAKTIETIDDLKAMIGQELGVGGWVEVKQEDVDTFADLTGDHQWIHVDRERAAKSDLGGTIAHGYMTLSILPKLRAQSWEGVIVNLKPKMGLNYGMNRVRFISPVHVGKRIRVRTKLLSVDEVQPNVYQTCYQQTVEIEGQEKPAMVAETLGRTYL
jgi:acyl dehydratase